MRGTWLLAVINRTHSQYQPTNRTPLPLHRQPRPGEGTDVDGAASGASGLFAARTFSSVVVCAGGGLGLVMAAAAGMFL